jgi:hypothetical protein
MVMSKERMRSHRRTRDSQVRVENGVRRHFAATPSCTDLGVVLRSPSLTTQTTSSTMKALYPASHDIPKLNESVLALKIARHSHCSTCNSCSGLRPSPGVTVELDDADELDNELGELAGYGEDDVIRANDYLHSCKCGHSVTNHGADKAIIGQDEFNRRGRTAVRLDEILQVSTPRSVGASTAQLSDILYRYGDLHYIYC